MSNENTQKKEEEKKWFSFELGIFQSHFGYTEALIHYIIFMDSS